MTNITHKSRLSSKAITADVTSMKTALLKHSFLQFFGRQMVPIVIFIFIAHNSVSSAKEADTNQQKNTQTAATISPCTGHDCQNERTLSTNNKRMLQTAHCEARLKSMNCATALGDDKKIRNCETDPFETETFEDSADDIIGCLKGYGQFFSDLIPSPTQIAKMAWAKTTHDARYYDSNVYRACKEREENYYSTKNAAEKKNHLEHLTQCKKRLLEEFSDLDTIYRDSKYNASYDTIRNDVHKRLAEIESQKATLRKYLDKNPDFFKSLARDAKKLLVKQGIKYECYNKQEAAKMLCYGYLSVLSAPLGAEFALKFLKEIKNTRAFTSLPENRAADRLNLTERRTEPHPVITGPELHDLDDLKLKSVNNLPSGLLLGKAPDGSKHLVYAERLPSGEYVRASKEIHIDPLTGVIDGNFPSGREFFEKVVKSKAGKAHVAFVDVGILRFVSKEFAKGEKAGDLYLKSVVEKIQKHGGEKVTIVRLGGDEFGLVIDEVDPKKVKTLLEAIQKDIRTDLNADAKKVFREEKIARAKNYKSATPEEKSAAQDKLLELSYHQQPDISVGSAQIGHQDEVEDLLKRTEDQSREMKIKTALHFGRSARKYGSDEPPYARAKPSYRAEIEEPASSPSWADKPKNAELRPNQFKLENLRPLKYTRVKKVKRFVNGDLAEFVDELGETSFRVERIEKNLKTGKSIEISHEIPVRANTGLLDGLHPESKKVIEDHFYATPGRTLIQPRLRSLKYANYYIDGTNAGDTMLKAVARTLERAMREDDVLFKLKGNEFLTSIDNIAPKDLPRLQERWAKVVANDPEVKALIAKERDWLETQLKAALKSDNKEAVRQFQEAIEDPKRFEVDLQFQTIKNSEVPKNTKFDDLMKIFEDKYVASDAAKAAK